MSIDCRLRRSYNFHLVIKLDERNELEIELAEDAVSEEINEEPLAGQICLFELLAEIRC